MVTFFVILYIGILLLLAKVLIYRHRKFKKTLELAEKIHNDILYKIGKVRDSGDRDRASMLLKEYGKVTFSELFEAIDKGMDYETVFSKEIIKLMGW